MEEPLADSILRRNARVAFVVAVCLTLLLGILSWYTVRQAAKDAAWVSDAHEISTTLEAILRHLDDVETGARGFELSGDTRFLEPYQSGKIAVGRDLQTLGEKIADPGEKQFLQTLAGQARVRIETAGNLVALRESSGSPASHPRLEGDKQLMDRVRATIAGMEAEQTGVLAERSRRSSRAEKYALGLIVSGSLLGVILLFIAGMTVNREIGVSIRSRGEVRAANAELESRVEQRTWALKAEAAARRQAEVEARKQAALLDLAHDAILVRDLEGRVIFWNLGAERMYGWSAAEAKGMLSNELLQTDFPSPDGLEPMLTEKGEWEGELRHTTRQGVEVVVASRWSMEREEGDGALAIMEINRDITDRKREEEVREQLAAIVDSCDDAIIGMTLQGIITAWNRGAEKIFGYPASEAIGKSMLISLPADRIDEELEILARIGQGETVAHYQTKRVRKDGAGIDVSVTISALRDRGGVIVGATKISREISEQKRADDLLAAQARELLRRAEDLLCSQHALEGQKLMLQCVLDSIGEGLIAADEKGRFILWNPAAEKMIGLGAAVLPPTDWAAHYGAYFPDGVTLFPLDQYPLMRAIRGETTSAEMIFKNSKLQRQAYVEINGAPLRDKDGMVRGGVVAFRDITQKKAHEVEIRQLNRDLEKRIAQLEASNRELEVFCYSVSHDLRAPLRHIGGFSRILIDDFGHEMGAEARGHLQRVEDAVIRMSSLIDGLLSLARVGQQSLELRCSEVNTLVEQVISILQPECEGRDVSWRVEQLPPLECDPVLMGQVFQNLLGNALKYSGGRASAVIEVGSTQQLGEPPVIFVRDNGAGFDMNYAQKLFGVFQRMHTTAEFEGTGVGLATVRRIIEKHGGRVWAEAEPDRGATFYFTVGANR